MVENIRRPTIILIGKEKSSDYSRESQIAKKPLIYNQKVPQTKVYGTFYFNEKFRPPF